MKVAVIGATGVVGSVLLQLLEKRKFPVEKIIPVASQKSVGNKISFNGQEYNVVSLNDAINMKPDIALFSAGGSTSLEWAPKFAEIGTRVVDNSSAWRMDSTKKLIVSEVNSNVLTKDDYIIANPNCSTMQMLVVLAPLHEKYKIKRLVISTYQSVSGTGKNAIDQLNDERGGRDSSKVYPYSIDQNLLPHCDVFEEGGYTKEENKLINETRKILNDNSIQITSTAVRVPIEICHGESVNIEFENEFEVDGVFEILKNAPGVIVEDDPKKNKYPMPINSANKDEVFVGRIRRDFSIKSGLNLWIVADNLRKGAATNTIQIAEKLIEMEII
ncbi:MAG: aspartate-semialdehyde dehydrogenase [Cryomorphaceae bacterium]|jgi:aspartate-semialdehyde dehydrogenase|nr:aspartate-semialdehyde dehydrogenase [Cryomorphaceae bacterium]MDG1889344.1 aspartate-semialdehyde dehydrogenase [Flavobacteriaceae bacterium]MBT3689470.1 aspartate-semialdehyde dehydrogenase [Cryomorphaceae bacterium]MBT4222485.1 aspartate-semialdehyde dehydrogenase [Cryomorphaceae bacterium]MBT4294084.1 aspartate-semialdehyde dehydrogenase [Cryomorphaceae bacterium]|tara:strand:+ start:510 stop:1499 length:990 start_codon:yes stop_codon:yes gene_type:complete